MSEAMTPYGLALVEYFERRTSAAVTIRRDDGVEASLPVRHYFREPSEFTPIEVAALDHCCGEVLDVGAGAGIHSLALQSRSLPVTAIDISPQAVAIMLRRGVRVAHRADIFDCRGGPFDTLVLLGHGIAMVEDLAGLDAFLVHARELTRAGGQILLDLLDVGRSREAANLAYHEANRRGGALHRRDSPPGGGPHDRAAPVECRLPLGIGRFRVAAEHEVLPGEVAVGHEVARVDPERRLRRPGDFAVQVLGSRLDPFDVEGVPPGDSLLGEDERGGLGRQPVAVGSELRGIARQGRLRWRGGSQQQQGGRQKGNRSVEGDLTPRRSWRAGRYSHCIGRFPRCFQRGPTLRGSCETLRPPSRRPAGALRAKPLARARGDASRAESVFFSLRSGGRTIVAPSPPPGRWLRDRLEPRQREALRFQ